MTRARDATRRVVFVGTERGLEKTIVPKAGFPLEFVDVGGLKGKSPVELITNLARLHDDLVSAVVAGLPAAVGNRQTVGLRYRRPVGCGSREHQCRGLV